MANIMTKRGTQDNIVTYEHFCDTTADIANISPEYITLGSIAVVLQGNSGILQIYMANSNKQWILLNVGAGESGEGLTLEEVNELIADALGDVVGFGTQVVNALPQSDINTGTIYLVANNNGNNDAYDEYIYVNDSWEKIGSTSGGNQLQNIRDGAGPNSIEEGQLTGNNAVSATGYYAHAEGLGTKASSYQSHAEGAQTTASGNQSHAEGSNTTASGGISHAEGSGTTASGDHSHAEGSQTVASDVSAHAEGYKTEAIAYAHAEGYETKASGSSSHTEGYKTKALSNYAHAEGAQTTASGVQSHAEGISTTASGSQSHAEGAQTVASGSQSHAEGIVTTASESCAHAEGIQTLASGYYSHAEGANTTASGNCSHAEGSFTIANHNCQHVFGQFNIADPSTANIYSRGTYVEIVGNGSDAPGGRSNARTLDWSGNETLAGTLTTSSDGIKIGNTTLTESQLQSIFTRLAALEQNQ